MIRPYIRIAALALLCTLGAGIVSAKQERVTAENILSGVSVMIPAHAVQVAENVFSIGTSIDPEYGDVVEGYMIVHKKRGYGKPSGTPGNGGGGSTTGSTCYTFLANGAKWKGAPEPWKVNPWNEDGISQQAVYDILANGIAKWEDAADGTVGNGDFVDILGTGTLTNATLVADDSSMDTQNEVYFGPLDQGTIGVTIVWGIFGGKPQNRELREWDQVYNTHYPWSDSGAVGAMDFDNIATHELGHSFGLGDLYTSACSAETMYGYGDLGETQKRNLNFGDIAGISTLY